MVEMRSDYVHSPECKIKEESGLGTQADRSEKQDSRQIKSFRCHLQKLLTKINEPQSYEPHNTISHLQTWEHLKRISNEARYKD